MKPFRRSAALLVLCLVMQAGMASRAWAEETTIGTDLSAGAISLIATVITVPLKLITCAGTVVLGGTVYGLTMGTSEVIREELVAGTNYTCGGRYYVSPRQVKQLMTESELKR